jgi:hypothetical protein
MSNDQANIEQKVLSLVRDAVRYDQQLRTKYDIGHKFRFISERLTSLLSSVEESMPKASAEETEQARELLSDEILVYVHLFNVHGLQMATWNNMLTPHVFYEYSVNRPIYTEQNLVESLVKNKANKMQHGYLIVPIKRSDIVSSDGLKDSLGHPVVRIKEGSLKFERLVSFVHNGQEYFLKSGVLKLK